MRRVINGYRYDTDKSTEIAEHGNGYPGDFRFWAETLYRTSKGRWFVAGEGGPLSHWSRPGDQQGTTTGSEGIRPLTDEAARRWLEDAEETEALEKYFEVEDA